jgi:hypothetical protein
LLQINLKNKPTQLSTNRIYQLPQKETTIEEGNHQKEEQPIRREIKPKEVNQRREQSN